MADMQMAAQTAGGCSDAQGTLPACAPLANPYVPFQNDNPERYAAGRALMKGTLFPGLDLPYRGAQSVEPRSEEECSACRSCRRRTSRSRSWAYISTRMPTTLEAVQLFNEYVEQYELLRQQMADGGFALTQTEAAMCGRYTWLDDPWPWDAETEA